MTFTFLDYAAAKRLLEAAIGTHPADCACRPPLWLGEHDGPPEPCQADCGRWIETGVPCALIAGRRVCFDCGDAAEKAHVKP